MKARLFSTLLLSFFFYLLSSQVPQGFNYQAIARDGSGNPITGATISVRLSILSDTGGFYATGNGTYIWEETHSNVKTNAYGLFTIVLGSPTAVKFQGSAASFSAINWSAIPLYIGTKIANPTVYKILGSAKLWTVPYSMVSGSISGPLKKLSVKGETTDGDSILFEVKNKTGQTIFAVYNEGVRIYVDNGDAATKGTTKGGFAIGGFGTAKAPSQEYFRVTKDSTRVYVNPLAKGTKGGFAIGGFSPGKGGDNNYLDLTPQNYFIGQGAGKSISTGVYNVLIGMQAGYFNTSGHFNIMAGRQAGYNSTTSSSNIYIGDQAAYNNETGYQNVMIGDWAGYSNTLGWQNVFLGAEAGWNNTIGNYNNYMGFESGYKNISGSFNSFIGYKAGFNNTIGEKNTYIGYHAGYSALSASGSNNIFMGVEAGFSNLNGYDNIAIGNKAGRSNTGGTFNVMIGSDAGNTNISGNFNTLVGYKSGEKTVSDYGTMVGYLAGNLTSSGYSQTMFGYKAGSNNTGSYNTFVGVEAGAYSGTGTDNTYMGLAAGDYATGSVNVFLGQYAGYSETGSNKLIISTGYTGADNLNNALIFGDFTAKFLKFNAKVRLSSLGVNADAVSNKLYVVDDLPSIDNPAILGQHAVTPNWGIGVKGVGAYYGVMGESTYAGAGFRAGVYGIASGGETNYGVWGSASGTNAYAGYFNGNVYVTGTLNVNGTIYSSDRNLKKNISPISGSLQKVLNLQGVTYEWKSDAELGSANMRKSVSGKESESRSFNFPSGLQLGVIAQDVEKILPELVHTDADGLKSVDYVKMIPLLIEAIKDQQKQIEELKTLVNTLTGQPKSAQGNK
jgi:hypothetical protein